jgi:hypothetical protein
VGSDLPGELTIGGEASDQPVGVCLNREYIGGDMFSGRVIADLS